MARATVAELKEYVKDFEVGVAVRFDDLEAFLNRIESDLAVIKEHLVATGRHSENNPNGRYR